jgi:signal transduction histidine kinase/CheY-like chemotaxis protein/HPt (histidine-containing phosphotransfer) domain-containing protein
MTPKTTDDLFAPFDFAVFEQVPGGLFRALGRLPAWLEIGPGPADLAEQFPMIEIFLSECEAGWETGEPVQSDVWTESRACGGEIYLQAVAVAAGGRRFIGLRSLPQELFTYQQLFHDFELAKERVESLNRELDLKRREAERATQAKSDFLAAMSHEIRTPLNAIIGMADVLSSTSLTRDQQKYVEIFQRNGVALLNLINDILDLSKVEAGHVELEATDLDLREVIARTLEVVEVRASAKGLWMRQTIAADVPRYLIGDPSRLRQIVINLLGNSIKFTDQGGILVQVERDPEGSGPGDLRFRIVDTGIGIPEEKRGLIFESFSQVDSSTTRKYGGTGLGLTISKQLVELMNGRIWVESEVGAGSSFFFTARFRVPDDQSERAAEKVRIAQAPLAELESRAAGLRILLVDDSEDNRVLILSYLKRTQTTIDIAEDGQSAVDRFRAGHYDVVLMDVEMPVMDGHEATREIRRIEKTIGARPTPVLALTAHAFSEMAVEGYEAGFTALLTKPIRQAALLDAVGKYGARAETGPAVEQVIETASADSIRVRVAPDMEDIVPGYLEKRRADVAAYRTSLDAGDFDSIRKLAHKMRGTGAGYGFPKLTELGESLEKAAILSDAATVRTDVEEFALYVNRIELEYQN